MERHWTRRIKVVSMQFYVKLKLIAPTLMNSNRQTFTQEVVHISHSIYSYQKLFQVMLNNLHENFDCFDNHVFCITHEKKIIQNMIHEFSDEWGNSFFFISADSCTFRHFVMYFQHAFVVRVSNLITCWKKAFWCVIKLLVSTSFFCCKLFQSFFFAMNKLYRPNYDHETYARSLIKPTIMSFRVNIHSMSLLFIKVSCCRNE